MQKMMRGFDVWVTSSRKALCCTNGGVGLEQVEAAATKHVQENERGVFGGWVNS